MKRRSSRGNPYHDERGRFTTADGCRKKSREKSEYDYAVQTAQRKRAENPPPEVDAYVVSGEEVRTVFGNKIQDGMIVEYDPAWAEPGNEEAESKYLFVVKETRINEKGEGWADIMCLNSKASFATIQRVDAESIRPASKEKVQQTEASMTTNERLRMSKLSGLSRPNGQMEYLHDAVVHLFRQDHVENVKLNGGNLR